MCAINEDGTVETGVDTAQSVLSDFMDVANRFCIQLTFLDKFYRFGQKKRTDLSCKKNIKDTSVSYFLNKIQGVMRYNIEVDCKIAVQFNNSDYCYEAFKNENKNSITMMSANNEDLYDILINCYYSDEDSPLGQELEKTKFQECIFS